MGIDSTRVGQGKEVETLSGEAMWNEVKRAGSLEQHFLSQNKICIRYMYIYI